uniref:Putative the thap domain is a dna-binding domain protein n=1 Tax=Culex tarsalis TaxID=7177 RepID=A0A1Q3G171_CULTA
MRSKYCRVSSCYNKRERDGIKFFSFPRDPTLCEQWVIFCCCDQTADVFYAGGVFALQNYAICAEHFEPSACVPPGRLVPGAVPRLKPGRTLPVASTATPAIVREPVLGVVTGDGEEVPTEIVALEEVYVKQEDEKLSTMEFEVVEPLEEEVEQESTQIPNEVLVEMLDPEEIKEEALHEFEEVEPVMLEELPSNEIEIIEIEEEVETKKAQHQSDCIFATGKLSNFEARYNRQIWQNKNTESKIEIEKCKYSQMVEKYQQASKLLAAKRRKKQQLQRKLQEYKRIGPEALLRSMDSANAKSGDDESDSSWDETKAWW